jgi:lactoylglutathione lyase
MTEKTRITGFHTIGVPVTDQDRALTFYTDVLGFEKRIDASFDAGRRWIEVAPPGSAITIALIAASPKVPASVETGIRLTSADADTDHQSLLARGVDVDEMLRWPGVPPMFAFRDVDGNGLEIVQES